ncbi:MAG TPA: hybrid sensor histidine kinase/response regulator [Pseudomonas sp.]|uniref:hybrid sensor histidine kinase/response regulator n=1 Tax=Stutzerimonas nitrititolerans TaxID=2482751 RepID=UPI000E87A22C|nr:CHASE domain-containing protein [Stutzerimonas nitrititolerans]HBB77766.1 hybrid sensor histidine kinase/response regulator [Pseudomonas sp.]
MSEPSTIKSARVDLPQLFNWRNGIAWLVLAFTLLGQLLILQQLRANSDRAAEQQFELLVGKVTNAIEQRLIDHEQILFGAAGLFAASGEVSRAQWRAYVERQQLADRYPGIQGVGFSKVVRASEREAHEQSIRAEGFADYRIQPEGERPVYMPIVYLEPFNDRNRAAFGYDMYAEPVRHQAMRQAASTGKSRISGKVILRQETHGKVQAGMLIYVPLYHPAMPLETAEQRMDALLGFAYSPYRMDDLMGGILGAADLNLSLRIYSGPTQQAEQLLFASKEHAPGDAAHSQDVQLNIYGGTWTLHMESLPAFEAGFSANEGLVAILGAGISLLLFFLISSLAFRQRRAEILAGQMTERIRENKRALQLSEERLSLALKGSNDGLWDLNLAADTFYASPRTWHMLGYQPGELQLSTRLWEQVLVAEDLPRTRAQLAQTMLSRLDQFTSELRFRHKDGRTVPVLVRGYIQRDAQGQPLRISGTSMDLTEHKRIEQMKNDFVSTVSHELRTPLTSISGALGLINGGALGEVPPAMQQMLDIAHRNSQRLGHLINDLLDMEKIAAGKMSFDMHEHSLYQLLEEALASNQAFAAQLGVNCVLREAADVQVWVDASRLQQVLGNFLSNAIKYTPEGGEVSLHCSVPDATHVRISVTDQGPGIAAEFRARVFEKFAQADASDSRQKGGTGLGLAITKEFIERMGGTVGFDTAEGQGTTFWCELPILETCASTPEPGRRHLLVVEDEPDTGRLLYLMLHDAGYSVERVQSLHAAREKLADHRYDAITLDLHLPDGSGAQLIEEIRRNPLTRHLPIVVISAASHFDQKTRDPRVVWLHKPISTAQLLVALGKALND